MNLIRTITLSALIFSSGIAHSFIDWQGDWTFDQTPVGKLTRMLQRAAQKGDVATMRECIELGANVNYSYDVDFPQLGRSILTEAIDSKSPEAVKLLLEHGANVETGCGWSSWAISDEIPWELRTRYITQLSYAIVAEAPIETIKLLIQYSKDLNIIDPIHEIGWTPYKLAALYKNYEAMELLAQAGAHTDSSLPVKKKKS